MKQESHPFDFLLSSSSDKADAAGVKSVRVDDKGSVPQCVMVFLQGVPVYGLIDSGADISIIGGSLFKRVATVAKLRKRDFQKADRTPQTYVDLDVSFADKKMRTPIYVKMDAHDQLLLSEGICRQLGIITYHTSVEHWRGGKGGKTSQTAPKPQEKAANVPTVRVSLVQSEYFLPHQSRKVEVKTDSTRIHDGGCVLFEPTSEDGVAVMEPALIPTTDVTPVRVMVSNPTGSSFRLEEGCEIGELSGADVIEPLASDTEFEGATANTRMVRTTLSETQRKEQLRKVLGETELLDSTQREKLVNLRETHHAAFSLDEQERGETDAVELKILTGDAAPNRVPPRRMPFAVRQEVARQLHVMQENGVIQPSSSPWASPVVIVRKKDGSHRFCVDHRALNQVTKTDTYPLPRINDLLDQLGKCRFFSTPYLASGYWQIRAHADSQEKTAFVTPRGLYEFRVMPFGLTNAPAVFQRLMDQVLIGLNPEDGTDFVSVYIDDIVIFSETLEDHLRHISLILERILKFQLKLKPTKCKFIRREVEYLGHLVTPDGLKTNPRIVDSIRQFARPTNVSELRLFLGLDSNYRRFIHQFSCVAEPFRALICKDTPFSWSDSCEDAMTKLKEKLTSAPVLAYPLFDRPFIATGNRCQY